MHVEWGGCRIWAAYCLGREAGAARIWAACMCVGGAEGRGRGSTHLVTQEQRALHV